MAILIFGRQGCGKTNNAELLRIHFGMDQVIDDWVPGMPMPPKTLLLTATPGCPGALSFDDALVEARREVVAS